jgi:phospholipid transport system substrate-binding protein
VKRTIFLAIILLTALPAVAEVGQPVDALKAPIQQVVEILDDPQYNDPALRDDQREKIRSATKDMFDFDLIAKRATGRYHWENSFTPQQRQEFTDLFARFLGNNYLSRISDDLKGLKVEYLDQDIDAVRKRARVKTKIPASNGDLTVDYSMRLTDGQWKIYDVYVEGVSLVQNYQTQFRDLFEKESAKQVIDRLRQKIKDQEQQIKTSG